MHAVSVSPMALDGNFYEEFTNHCRLLLHAAVLSEDRPQLSDTREKCLSSFSRCESGL